MVQSVFRAAITLKYQAQQWHYALLVCVSFVSDIWVHSACDYTKNQKGLDPVTSPGCPPEHRHYAYISSRQVYTWAAK